MGLKSYQELITMPLRTITTTDHAEITSWVERHGGIPCRVRSADSGEVELRIDFPDAEELEPLGWESWFQFFDESRLAFLYEIGADEQIAIARPQLIQPQHK